MARTVGVTMMRDEEDVARYVVAHMLDECDDVIVADNGSVDGTRGELEELAQANDRLLLVEEPRFAYYQSETMMRLADLALDMGATWVVPFDADEWWYALGGRPIREALAEVTVPISYAMAYDMLPGSRDRADEPNPFLRITRRREKAATQKVAFQPGDGRRLVMGNHHIEGSWESVGGVLEIRHYPYRSLEQATRKLRQGRAALTATDFDPAIGAHWRELGAMPDDQLAHWWRKWCAG